jgi:transglutaminase/protease-like cytokinesis protein 3
MKRMSCILLIVHSLLASAQKDPVYINYIDRAVRSFNASSPAKLAEEITSANQTDRQKVISIFRWITDNISYNIRAKNRNTEILIEEPDDTGQVLKPLNLRVAETVLQRRLAVCDGYARLFKTLCDNAGIPSEIIMGYARTNSSRGRVKFGSNHTWNAAYIDSAWYLLDATWASGGITYKGDEFIRGYNSRYFLTPPDQFIIDHYPEDIKWTLLNDPPAQPEFLNTPFRYTGFIKSGIDAYLPSKGIIEASIGDSIRFEVRTSNELGLLTVSSTPPVDTIWFDDEPVVIGGRRKSCTYTVTDEKAEWLYVSCNGRVILRYKLNVRRLENKMAMTRPG